MGLDTFAMMHNPLFKPRAKRDLWFQGKYVPKRELPDWAEISGMAVRQYALIRMPRKLFIDVPNVLCGGLFSGHGSGSSFRGKAYDDLIEATTGVSLYQEEIPNEVVKDMAGALEVLVAAGVSPRQCRKLGVKEEEFEALAKWFQVVADNDGVVIGWW